MERKLENRHLYHLFCSCYFNYSGNFPLLKGNLSSSDVGAHVKDMDDPYGNEPRRHVALKPSSKKPFNAEPPLPLLADNLITPKYVLFFLFLSFLHFFPLSLPLHILQVVYFAFTHTLRYATVKSSSL